MKRELFSVGSGRNWRYSPIFQDGRRHREKIKAAMVKNLAEMVSDEQILVSKGSKLLRIPVSQHQEFRIRYDPRQGESVGTGDPNQTGENGGGSSEKGGQGPRPAGGKEGGSSPGQDIEETEVELETVANLVFSDFRLPELDPAKKALGVGETADVTDLGRVGLKNQWDRRSTYTTWVRRRCVAPSSHQGLLASDIRYRQFDPVPDNTAGAVVLAMMDTSGSMGNFEKYLAKSFFFWTVEFLRRNYPHVELVFLSHDVRAREVDEESFFRRGTSGGTVSSSVYRLAREILAGRFPQDQYNAYAFHFTDGGNLTSDNSVALEEGMALSRMVQYFGYGEIHDTERSPSPLFQGFETQGAHVVLLRSGDDIFRALRHFFGKGTQHAQTS